MVAGDGFAVCLVFAASGQCLALWAGVGVLLSIIAKLVTGGASLFGDGFGFVGYGNVDLNALLFAGFDLFAVVISRIAQPYQKAFIFAFIGITAIVLINFRNVRFALLGLLPLGVGLLLMVGGMGALGIRFNSANIIVLPLILGVGIDSAIYIINRYRQGAETPGEVAAGSAGVGVFLNALTILSSFGTLMVARHQGVFSIGAVMSLGMTATVVAFLLFLPSLLSLWGKRT